MDFPVLQILNLVKKDIRGSCLIVSPADLTKKFQKLLEVEAVVQRVINGKVDDLLWRNCLQEPMNSVMNEDGFPDSPGAHEKNCSSNILIFDKGVKEFQIGSRLPLGIVPGHLMRPIPPGIFKFNSL